MALSAFVGSFVADTSGTSRALTLFGHQPKLWLPWFTLRTAMNGWSTADFEFGAGMTTGPNTEMAHCLRLNHANVPPTTRRGTKADSCLISVLRNSAGEDGAYDTTSLDPDGVTLNISNPFGTAGVCPHSSLSGTDFAEADVLQIATPNELGPVTYSFPNITGAPVLLRVTGTGRTALLYGSTGAFFDGWADENGQWAMMTKGSEGSPSVNGRLFRTDHVYAAHAITSSIFIRAAFDGFGTDINGNGTVTLDWTAVGLTESQVVTLTAIRGSFAHQVGTFNKAVASPWTNTLSTASTPRWLFLASACMGSDWYQVGTGWGGSGSANDAVPQCRGAVGFYDGTNMRQISWEDENNVTTSNVASCLTSVRTLVIGDNATGTSSDELIASFVGTDAILTSQLNSVVPYQVGYVLLADPASAGGAATPLGGLLPQYANLRRRWGT